MEFENATERQFTATHITRCRQIKKRHDNNIYSPVDGERSNGPFRKTTRPKGKEIDRQAGTARIGSETATSGPCLFLVAGFVGREEGAREKKGGGKIKRMVGRVTRDEKL